MPKLVTKKATVSTFDGETLPNGGITFNYSYDEIQDRELDSLSEPLKALVYPEWVTAKEKPEPSDLVSLLNAKRNASERARRQAEELTNNGIVKKELKDNPRVRYLMIFKALTAGGSMSAEDADAMARAQIKDYTGPAATI